jgi:SDR family mycofactocin-dependent oxidoreductase
MGILSGKVALISGAARGQGRSHAVRLAEEGAEIIGFDICKQIETVEYPMPTADDLAETVKLVDAAGGRMVAFEADVRDRDAIATVVADGVAEFGHLDILIANAGIFNMTGAAGWTQQAWRDSIEVMLTGTYNTITAAVPVMVAQGTGGSVVITNSTAGLNGLISDLELASPGCVGYIAAKHGLVGVMQMYAKCLGPHNIRCNSVHPCAVDTPMIKNEAFARWITENPQEGARMQNRLPVELIEPVDVSNAIVWLCSDAGRYVTGVTLPVDAGYSLR